MPIYPHHKAIFVHIPKNGGSTVTTMLKRKRFFELRRSPEDPRGKGCETIFQLIDALGDEADEYFKFSFVRNPWDRFVSAYHYVLQRRPELETVTRHASFEEFAADFAANPEQYLGIRYFRPQWGYISDANGVTPLDFVGRIERFDEDMKRVFAALGISRPWVRHRKRSRRGDYRGYFDARSRDAVGAIYRRDVEEFGYCFEPGAQ